MLVFELAFTNHEQLRKMCNDYDSEGLIVIRLD